jgi:hypothetical protein
MSINLLFTNPNVGLIPMNVNTWNLLVNNPGGDVALNSGANIDVSLNSPNNFTISTTLPVPGINNNGQVLGVVDGSYELINNSGGGIQSISGQNDQIAINDIDPLNPIVFLPNDIICPGSLTTTTDLTCNGDAIFANGCSVETLIIDGKTFPAPTETNTFLNYNGTNLNWSAITEAGSITQGSNIDISQNGNNFIISVVEEPTFISDVYIQHDLTVQDTIDCSSIVISTYGFPTPAVQDTILSFDGTVMKWIQNTADGVQTVSGTINQINVSTDPINPIISLTNDVLMVPNSLMLRTTENLNNQAIGPLTMLNNTTGANNIAVGLESLTNNTTGSNNIGMGLFSLQNNTTGYLNIAIGQDALKLNTSSNANICIGNEAGLSIGTGTPQSSEGGNVIIGAGSGNTLNSGYENIAIGTDIFNGATTDYGNIILGVHAVNQAHDNNNNIMIVLDSDPPLVNGFSNIVMGLLSGNALETANDNILIGNGSAYSVENAQFNIIMGTNACNNSTSAQNTISLGYQSLENCTNPVGNIAIGNQSGSELITGNGNLILGTGAQCTDSNMSGQIVIGSSANTSLSIPCCMDYNITTNNQITFSKPIETPNVLTQNVMSDTIQILDGAGTDVFNFPILTAPPSINNIIVSNSTSGSEFNTINNLISTGQDIIASNGTNNLVELNINASGRAVNKVLKTDPIDENILIWADNAGSAGVQSVAGAALQIAVNDTDPQNPIIFLPDIINAPGSFSAKQITLDNMSGVSTFTFPLLTSMPTENQLIVSNSVGGSNMLNLADIIYPISDISATTNTFNGTCELNINASNRTPEYVLAVNPTNTGLNWVPMGGAGIVSQTLYQLINNTQVGTNITVFNIGLLCTLWAGGLKTIQLCFAQDYTANNTLSPIIIGTAGEIGFYPQFADTPGTFPSCLTYISGDNVTFTDFPSVYGVQSAGSIVINGNSIVLDSSIQIGTLPMFKLNTPPEMIGNCQFVLTQYGIIINFLETENHNPSYAQLNVPANSKLGFGYLEGEPATLSYTYR